LATEKPLLSPNVAHVFQRKFAKTQPICFGSISMLQNPHRMVVDSFSKTASHEPPNRLFCFHVSPGFCERHCPVTFLAPLHHFSFKHENGECLDDVCRQMRNHVHKKEVSIFGGTKKDLETAGGNDCGPVQILAAAWDPQKKASLEEFDSCVKPANGAEWLQRAVNMHGTEPSQARIKDARQIEEAWHDSL
jgi:hypothetical protein